MRRLTPFYTPLGGRKRVYISGPMTGFEGYNIPAFDAAAKKLRHLSYSVCSPAETSTLLGWHLEHEDYMRFDFERVLEADFVAVLEGWEDSKGARAEISMALHLGVSCWPFEGWGHSLRITEEDVAAATCIARWKRIREAQTPQTDSYYDAAIEKYKQAYYDNFKIGKLV